MMQEKIYFGGVFGRNKLKTLSNGRSNAFFSSQAGFYPFFVLNKPHIFVYNAVKLLGELQLEPDNFADRRKQKKVKLFFNTNDTILEVLPMMVDNIRVAIENGTFSAEEAAYYIQELKHSTKKFTLKKVTMSRTDTYLDLRYSFNEIPFERIRRISLTRSHEARAVNN